MRKAPEIRFDGYTVDWEQRKLSELLSFSNGFNGDKDMYGKGIPYISVKDILNNDVITYDTIQGKVNLDEQVAQRYIVEYGDILFQRSSENIEDAGRSNVYVDTERTAVFGGFVIRGKKVSEYDPIFMKKNLETHEVRNQITSRAQGAQHINVGQEMLGSVKAYFPSLNEQKIIGIFFQILDSFITFHQKECEKMLDFKGYMLSKMFPQNGEKVPEIRFEDFTEDWEQRKLGDVVEFLDTQRKPLEGAKRVSGPYPYYGASGIVDYVDGYIFDEELVLLSEDGANITDRNYPICFLASGKYWVNNHAHVLKMKEGNENNFVCNSLERKDYKQYNTGMAMPKLNKEVCKNIPIFCPCFEEQKKIGDYFRHLDHFITLHQRKVEVYKKMKQYMLRNMFV